MNTLLQNRVIEVLEIQRLRDRAARSRAADALNLGRSFFSIGGFASVTIFPGFRMLSGASALRSRMRADLRTPIAPGRMILRETDAMPR